MKISVIMGVYNTPVEYLDKCITSLVKSLLPFDSEVLIFNDGSNETTTNYLEKLKETFPSIKILGDGKNHGLAYGLNRCIEIATGDYLVRMDSDDYCDKNRIKEQIEFMNDEKLDICGCSMNLFEGETIWGGISYNKKITKNDFIKNSPISHPTTIFKKNVFDTIRYSELKKHIRNEDYNLFIKMFCNGYTIGNLDKKLYYFREDDAAVARRNFLSRVNEMKVRYEGYKLLGIKWYKYIYCLRPIIVYFLPKNIYKKIRNKKISNTK